MDRFCTSHVWTTLEPTKRETTRCSSKSRRKIKRSKSSCRQLWISRSRYWPSNRSKRSWESHSDSQIMLSKATIIHFTWWVGLETRGATTTCQTITKGTRRCRQRKSHSCRCLTSWAVAASPTQRIWGRRPSHSFSVPSAPLASSLASREARPNWAAPTQSIQQLLHQTNHISPWAQASKTLTWAKCRSWSETSKKKKEWRNCKPRASFRSEKFVIKWWNIYNFYNKSTYWKIE